MAQYNFNLPQITQLSLDQQNALNETNPIALSGGPGTGKTVVSIYRHLNLHKNNKKSMLITYTTTLAMYLRGSCVNQSKSASESIDTSLSFKKESAVWCHEIIVDEAQDLPSSYYEALNNYANKVSYGADDAQILYQNKSCSQDQLKNIFKNNKLYQLGKNYRSTKSILNFARAAFSEAYIKKETIDSCKQLGNKPILLYSNNIKSQDNAIVEIVKRLQRNIGENIAILTPLATVPWAGGERLTAKYYFDLLNNSGINDVSYYDYTLHGIKEIKGIHVTPFKSSKGLEFDTVIIPCFDSLFIEFKVINWRDYFVGATRAKSNLYLICEKNISSFDGVTEKTQL
jgi:superfamily I DNA/RNA helicase